MSVNLSHSFLKKLFGSNRWLHQLLIDGALPVLLLLAGFVALELRAVADFAYFTPASSVEESAYAYTGAHNFIQFGFWNSLFLQDYSNSPDPADHPYVYTHFPPGPDILTALILMAFQGSYRAVHLVFSGLFLAGIPFYLRFVQQVLQRHQLRGSGYALLFFSPWSMLAIANRFPSALQPLLIFAPLVCINAFYQTGKRFYLALTLAIIFLSSLYLEYNALIAVGCCWVLLHLTQLVRVDRRHLWMVGSSIILGVGLKIGQNILYLGPETAFQELILTLGNRMFGTPSKEAMSEFYRMIGVVHHGSRSLKVSALLTTVTHSFQFLGWQFITVLMFVSAGWEALLTPWKTTSLSKAFSAWIQLPTIQYFLRLGLWITGTLLIPTLLFPAYGQEFALQQVGATRYFMAIGAVAVFMTAIRQLRQFWTVRHSSQHPDWFRGAIGMGLGVLLAIGGLRLGVNNAAQMREFSRSIQSRPEYVHLVDLQRFQGDLYMTNINTPTVGFFTQAAGFGVCSPTSISTEGLVNPGNCKVAFMRQYKKYLDSKPRYFFFVNGFHPGFSDCLPSIPSEGESCVVSMQKRLEATFTRLFKNDLIQVYDLYKPLNGISQRKASP